MSIPGISPTLISNAFLTQPSVSSDDLFQIGLHYYFAQLHQTILNAWESFKEGQKSVREHKESGSRSHSVRNQQDNATRIEGERRQVESRKVETEGDVPMHAGRPQRGQRLFHESGSYLDSSSRQLNLPI